MENERLFDFTAIGSLVITREEADAAADREWLLLWNAFIAHQKTRGVDAPPEKTREQLHATFRGGFMAGLNYSEERAAEFSRTPVEQLTAATQSGGSA